MALGLNPPRSHKLESRYKSPEPPSFSQITSARCFSLGSGSGRTRSQFGYLARSGEGSKAPPSASPPQTTVPQAWGQAGAASPAQPGRPGAHRADDEAAGWVGRALPGEQSPRHALLTPRADKRSLRGCRKPRAPCPHSVGKVRPPRPAGRAHRLTVGPRPPLSRAPAPAQPARLPTTLAHRCPAAPSGCPSLPGAQQWALHAAVAAVAGQRPGPQGHKAARPPRPPASRRPRRGPTRERLTFPEPARPRAPPSLCLWQTWLAEKRAPSPPPPPLPSGLPSCPAPGPLPALARSLALRSPRSLPPRRWLRALSSCQSVSPGRGPIALELLPRRLGLSCAAARPKPAARLLAARAPATRLRLRRPLRLQHRCLCRRRRWSTWSSTERGCPGRSAAGVHAPRRTAAAANRRAGAGPEAGRDACQRGRASPAAPPPRAAARSCPGRGSGGRALALGWGGDAKGWGLNWSTRPARRGLGAATAGAERGADPGWPGAPLSASSWPPAPPPPRADLPSAGQDPSRPCSLPHPGLPAPSPAFGAPARAARGAGQP